MKQRTAAPQTPPVAYARACDAFAMSIGGLGFSGATTATNLSTRRLGMRPT